MNFDESDNDSLEPAARNPGNWIERSPGDVERQITSTSEHSSLEELSAAIDAAEWLLARAKTVDRLMREIAIRWIDRHGEFNIGPMHYSAAYSTTIKCINVRQAGQAVLEAAGGDFGRFIETLVAQPFKHATVRSLLVAKEYQSLFKGHRTGRLIGGVPDRILKKSNGDFVRGGTLP